MSEFKKIARQIKLSAVRQARKGDKVKVYMRSPCIFRGQDLKMTESIPDTVVVRSISRHSDGKTQLPSFDTLATGDAYVFALEFLEDCEWKATMEGMAVP